MVVLPFLDEELLLLPEAILVMIEIPLAEGMACVEGAVPIVLDSVYYFTL